MYIDTILCLYEFAAAHLCYYKYEYVCLLVCLYNFFSAIPKPIWMPFAFCSWGKKNKKKNTWNMRGKKNEIFSNNVCTQLVLEKKSWPCSIFL